MACLASPSPRLSRRQAAGADRVTGSPAVEPGVPKSTKASITRPPNVPRFSEEDVKFPGDGGARGKGGFGSVRSCYVRGLGSCALKAALPGLDATAARLEKEAALVGRLQHPNVVPLWGTVHNAEGALTGFLMPEASTSAFVLLAECYDPLEIGDLTTVEKLDLILQLFLAVEHAHKQGLVHMDLKSPNVLLDVSLAPDGSHRVHLWLADWGITQTAERLETLDVTGAGSFDTTAPEQFRGKASTASDVYSAACVAVNILEGRPSIHAFGTTRAEARKAVLEEGFVPEIPEDLKKRLGTRGVVASNTLQACLQTKPHLRPSAEEVVAVLEEVLHGSLSKLPLPVPAALQQPPQAAQLLSPLPQPATAAAQPSTGDESSSAAAAGAAEAPTAASPSPAEEGRSPQGGASSEGPSPPGTPPPPRQAPPRGSPPGSPAQPAAAAKAPAQGPPPGFPAQPAAAVKASAQGPPPGFPAQPAAGVKASAQGPPPGFPAQPAAGAKAAQGPPPGFPHPLQPAQSPLPRCPEPLKSPLQPGLSEPQQAAWASSGGSPKQRQGLLVAEAACSKLRALAALCQALPAPLAPGAPPAAPLLSSEDSRPWGERAWWDSPDLLQPGVQLQLFTAHTQPLEGSL